MFQPQAPHEGDGSAVSRWMSAGKNSTLSSSGGGERDISRRTTLSRPRSLDVYRSNSTMSGAMPAR
jgi:hypothetical protein